MNIIERLERRDLVTKLTLGFGLIALLTLVIGLGGLFMLRQLNEEVHELYSDQLISVSLLKDTQFQLATMGRALRQYALARETLERERAKRAISDADVVMARLLETLRSRVDGDDLRRDVMRFESGFQRYRRNVDRVLALYERDRGDSPDGRAFLSSGEFQIAAQEAADVLAEANRRKESEAQQLVLRVAARTEQMRWWGGGMLAGGLGFCLLLFYLISRSIRRPTVHLATVVDRLAAGELDLKTPCTDYPNEIGQLARAIEVLQAGSRELELQRWVKTHEAEIAAALQEAENFVDLAQRFFSVIGPLLHIGQGAFYICEPAQRSLRLLAGYAWRERKHMVQHIALGQGLIGQCALERTAIMLAEAPSDYVGISSSLGEAVPGCILALPVLAGERLLGVIELAAFRQFSRDQQILLDGVLPLLAVTLENLERSTSTRQLLEQTQVQAEKIEAEARVLEHQKLRLEARQSALAETEAWYRGIIESAPDGMFVVDSDGEIVLVNPKAAEVFGYLPEELVGSNIDLLLPDAEQRGHAALRQRYMTEGAAQRDMARDRGQLKGRRKNGESFSIEVNLSRLPAVAGRKDCVCAAVRDIDQRQRLERAILESETRLRQVLDNSPAGVAIMAGDGRQLYANPRLAALFGVTPDEMKLKRSSEFWADPAERSRFQEVMTRDGSVSNFEATFRRGNGELVYVLLSTHVIELHEGRNLVSWFYDITALKQAEQALAEQAQLQQSLIDTIPYPIFYKGPDTRFLGFNRAYERTFGVSRESLIGKRVLDLDYLPEADRLSYQAEDEAVIANAGEIKREMLIPFADGVVHETLYSVSGFRLSNGQAGGLVGAIVDIASLKAAEHLLAAVTKVPPDDA